MNCIQLICHMLIWTRLLLVWYIVHIDDRGEHEISDWHRKYITKQYGKYIVKNV